MEDGIATSPKENTPRRYYEDDFPLSVQIAFKAVRRGESKYHELKDGDDPTGLIGYPNDADSDVAATSIRGLTHRHLEDHAGIAHGNNTVCIVVSDGTSNSLEPKRTATRAVDAVISQAEAEEVEIQKIITQIDRELHEENSKNIYDLFTHDLLTIDDPSLSADTTFPQQNATIVVAEIDTAKNMLTVTKVGDSTVTLIRNDGTIETIDNPQENSDSPSLLGELTPCTPVIQNVRLEPGDICLVHTDGFTIDDPDALSKEELTNIVNLWKELPDDQRTASVLSQALVYATRLKQTEKTIAPGEAYDDITVAVYVVRVEDSMTSDTYPDSSLPEPAEHISASVFEKLSSVINDQETQALLSAPTLNFTSISALHPQFAHIDAEKAKRFANSDIKYDDLIGYDIEDLLINLYPIPDVSNDTQQEALTAHKNMSSNISSLSQRIYTYLHLYHPMLDDETMTSTVHEAILYEITHLPGYTQQPHKLSSETQALLSPLSPRSQLVTTLSQHGAPVYSEIFHNTPVVRQKLKEHLPDVYYAFAYADKLNTIDRDLMESGFSEPLIHLRLYYISQLKERMNNINNMYGIDRTFTSISENQRSAHSSSEIKPHSKPVPFVTEGKMGPEANEDTVFADDIMVIVADGVGSAANAQKASRHIVNRLREALQADEWSNPVQPDQIEAFQLMLWNLIQTVNSELYDPRNLIETVDDIRGTAQTTLVVGRKMQLTDGGSVIIYAHVGDSRLYTYDPRSKKLTQISRDDSLLSTLSDPILRKRYLDTLNHNIERTDDIRYKALLMERLNLIRYLLSPDDAELTPEQGAEIAAHLDDCWDTRSLTPQESEFFRLRHNISAALGASSEFPYDPKTHKGSCRLEPGSRLIATSDGIHDNLTTDQIKWILQLNSSLPTDEVGRDLVGFASYIASLGKAYDRSKPDDRSAAVLTA
jgi:serine/threonine protein phosphatase PrpC